ncbi:hypothetical protein [Streptomyces sp. NPDC093094]|uniref:hypothetical protein n=1 Tax=Streptomyces sp. NPDC093094 TaxID=3366026 RepID=UPI003823DD4D
MSDRHAAAALARLWGELPALTGDDWPELRPRLLELVEATAAAGNDGERAATAGRLLRLVDGYPGVRAFLAPWFETDLSGPAGGPERAGPSWSEVAQDLLRAARAEDEAPGRARREAARLLGSDAGDRQITDTLVAAGLAAALALDGAAFMDRAEDLLRARPGVLDGRVPPLLAWADPLAWLRRHTEDVASLADMWQIAAGSGRDGVRLLVTDGPGREASLAGELSGGTAVLSVVHGARMAEPERIARWSWPLRLTVAPGPVVPVLGTHAREPVGEGLRQRLLTAAREEAGLTTLVTPSGRWNRTSLLLLPGPNAPDGDGADGADGEDEPAGATAVIGVVSSADPRHAARILRDQGARHRSALSAVAHPGLSPERWLSVLLGRLALDEPLDTALWQAARACGAPPPLIAADPRFLDGMRVRPLLASLAPGMLPPGEEQRLGRALRAAPGRDAVAVTRRTAERLREAARRARHVPSRFLRAEPVGRDGVTPLERIAPHREFRLRVRITGEGGTGPQPERFPSEALPPGATHRLTVLATELTPVTPRDRAAHRAEIELPGDGDSTSTVFGFRAGPPGSAVEIRVVVTCRGRFLQSGVLTGRVGAPEPPVFRTESVLRAPTDGLDLMRAHDAVLVVNRTASGVPLLAAQADDELRIGQPVNLGTSMDQLLGALTRMALSPDSVGPYGSRGFTDTLVELARCGRALRKSLFIRSDWDNDPLLRRLRNARSVSVYTARPGIVLPLELIYDRALDPDAALTLCAHAPGLVDRPDCEECPERGNRAVVCPFGFWGTSKVVERHVRLRDTDPGYAVAESPDAQRHSCVLDPVCAAASERADHNDEKAWTEATAALTAEAIGEPNLATDWAALKDLVQKLRDRRTPPGIVLLYPHSDEDSSEYGVLSLGEDDTRRVMDGMEFLFTEDGPQPVVFLLGCSTAGTDRLLSDASAMLLGDGAPGVVGTLAPVLARHVVPVGVRLLREFRARAAEPGGASLGEALLHARRALIVEGAACVLALIGFGDTDWELRVPPREEVR